MSLVSVIVPIYNVEPYLDRCVQSIAEQTYCDLEIILVDDGSLDNCPVMCDVWAEKDSRVKVFHKANGGVSDARNTGLTKATGDYICFIDADDFVSPFLVEKLIQNSRSGEIAVCRFCHMDTNDTVDSQPIQEKTFPLQFKSIKDLTKYRGGLFCWGILFPKEIIMQEPKIYFDTQLTNLEDATWLSIILTRVKGITFVDWDNPMYYYMVRDGALTQNCVDTHWQAASWIKARKTVEKSKKRLCIHGDIHQRQIFDQMLRHCLNNFYGECFAGQIRMSEIKSLGDRPAFETLFYKAGFRIRKCLRRR